jgi:hypothetical protein
MAACNNVERHSDEHRNHVLPGERHAAFINKEKIAFEHNLHQHMSGIQDSVCIKIRATGTVIEEKP